MDQYSEFGQQLVCRPKPQHHQIRVSRRGGRRVIRVCSCGRRFDPKVRHYLRSNVSRHTADIIDDAPGEW